MASSLLSYLLFVSLLLHSFSLSTNTNTNTCSIPISLFNTIPTSDDPFQSLSHIASTSKARAHHLKNPQNAPTSTTPLFPYSGAYSISLSFGTPPQSIPMVMDTGSSFSWLPCTKKYICKNCSVSSTFMPKQSSSAKILGCMNPKCGWIHKPFDPHTTCRDCESSGRKTCKQVCPLYIVLYGLGSTGGIPMVETLNMPNNNKVQNFLVGCSLFSSYQPAGIAGFGRGITSLPNQLGLKKFSYCLVSHKFDNTPKSSSLLFMDSEFDSGRKSDNFSYTPLMKNPISPYKTALSDYYYVGMRKITVGGKKIRVPAEQLVPDSDGDGGTIIDSGSTFTYMNKAVFGAIAAAFSDQVSEYARAKDVEIRTGLRPCFDVTGKGTVRLPELRLHFKGGAAMAPPLENYFIAVGGGGGRVAACLTVVTEDTVNGPENVSGPAVILGNFLMQDFGLEFDLRNERFGFRKQASC